MTLPLHVFFVLFVGPIVALKTFQLGAEYYHRASLGISTKIPGLDPINCAVVTEIGDEEWDAFSQNTVSPTSSCVKIPTSTRFIKAAHTSNEETAVKIWSKAPIPTIPHFLLVHSNAVVEDYSLDPEESPPITSSYPNWPNTKATWHSACGIFDSRTMRITARITNSLHYTTWAFNETSPTIVAGVTDDSTRIRSGCAVSNGGKILLTRSSGDSATMHLYQGGRGQLIPFTGHYRNHPCAVFHPTDENLVLIFGGSGYNTAISYNLEEGITTNLKSLNFNLYRQGCISLLTPNDKKPVVLMAGGAGYINDVILYDINSNSYNMNLPKLPKATGIFNLALKGNYVYAFGGYQDSGFVQTVLRIDSTFQTPWEELPDMSLGDAIMLIIPYN